MAKSFIQNISKNSDRDNDYAAHQVGEIVGYRGKDGIKYYVILERTEFKPSQQEIDHALQYNYVVPKLHVKLVTAMVANPFLEIHGRVQKRDFGAASVFVVNFDEWMQIQQDFMEAMKEAANERVTKFLKK